jgi:hypothetical protein
VLTEWLVGTVHWLYLIGGEFGRNRSISISLDDVPALIAYLQELTARCMRVT